MPDNGSPTHFDVAVIGAGQAGLAIGCLLARQDRRFVILDGADSIGASWRDRWDSLVLFTPRRYDSLPGLAFPGDPDGYPTRDEVVAYLEQYASTFELPVQLDSTVRSLAKNGRAFRARARRPQHRGRPGRDRNRAVSDAAGAELRQPARSLRCSRPTALTTGGRATSPTARSWLSVAATPATRSQPSCQPRITSTSPSAHAKRRYRRSSPAATCSGGLRRPSC